MRRHIHALCVFLALGLAGCAYRVAYNPSYVPSGTEGQGLVQGRGLLYMDPGDEAFTYSGRPSSFTGGGSTLVIPLGRIAREISARRFGRVFSAGCDQSSSMGNPAAYAAVVQVRVVSFEYRYNRMRNLDFATTPQVDIDIQVNAYDPAGELFFSKTYGTGWFSGKTVLDTLRPGELINRVAHEALSKLVGEAVTDVASAVRSRSWSAPAAPAVAPARPSASAPARPAAAPSGAPEERLKKLRQLYDDGLITKDVYEQKQSEVLESY